MMMIFSRVVVCMDLSLSLSHSVFVLLFVEMSWITVFNASTDGRESRRVKNESRLESMYRGLCESPLLQR
jgi:hypothetical protein